MSDPNSPYQPPAAHAPGTPQGASQGYPQGYVQGYGPGPYGSGSDTPPGGAAKWAAILLVVLAGLFVINAGLTMWQVSGTPLEEVMNPEDMQELQAQGMSLETIRGFMFGCVGACFGVMVLVALVLAAVVRKGGQAAAITALVIVGILALLSVIGLLAAVVGLAGGQTDAQQGAPAVIGVIYNLVELTVIGLLIVMLIRTIMQAGALKQYRMQQEMAQQQAQWQQYSQGQQGGYNQQGWGGHGPYDPPNG